MLWQVSRWGHLGCKGRTVWVSAGPLPVAVHTETLSAPDGGRIPHFQEVDKSCWLLWRNTSLSSFIPTPLKKILSQNWPPGPLDFIIFLCPPQDVSESSLWGLYYTCMVPVGEQQSLVLSSYNGYRPQLWSTLQSVLKGVIVAFISQG